MKISVVTPNYNGGAFLETTIRSVISQRQSGVDLEYIVVDGGSTDQSQEIIERYRREIDHVIMEKDRGPANAINKGLSAATGDVVSWLNSDDFLFPAALKRVACVLGRHAGAPFSFGNCPIVDQDGREIRKGITLFKKLFFPISCRFTFQCINYLSQPSVFFWRWALEKAGPLREDMVAAWDYDLFLRLWRQGRAVCIGGPPVAAFRWHEASISGQQFQIQFAEELSCAIEDAGPVSLQASIHRAVRLGIVGSYRLMSRLR